MNGTLTLTQTDMRDAFPAFFSRFNEIHNMLVETGRGHRGHGPDHDMLVGGYALIIADLTLIAKMAWVAAHLHSLDRFYGDEHVQMTDEMLALVWADDHNSGFTSDQIAMIREAVMKHGRPNEDDDNPVTVILKDADRLANMNPHVIVRSGQFQSELPVVEFGYVGFDKHPGSTYKAPRSIHDDLLGCLEWHPDSGTPYAIRTEAARPFANELYEHLTTWFTLSQKHMKLAGLD
jgi:hypothetical protein